MAATPKTGIAVFRGLATNAQYHIPLYNADVNGTYCRLDNGGGTPGATGGADYVKFGENVSLDSLFVVTGIVDTANLRIMVDYKPTSFVVNWAAMVNTLPNIPKINVSFAAGRQISFMAIP